MAATANSTITNKGQIKITTGSAWATATGLPAGTYTFDLVLRRFEEQEAPRRPYAQTNVTGGTIEIAGTNKGAYRYQMVFVDDYVKGATGELSTSPNQFTCTELLVASQKNNVNLDELAVTPAGSSAGMIEYTAEDVKVLYVSGPSVNADSEEPMERTADLAWNMDSFTEAAHA